MKDFDTLCAALEVHGVDGFEDWLEGVHDDPEWVFCETEVGSSGLRTRVLHAHIQDFDFELRFPCSLEDVYTVVHQMEEFVVRHLAAWHLSIDEWGHPEGEYDGTPEVAQLLMVEPEALLSSVGGPWIPLEDGPSGDSSGAPIYHWFGRGDPASVGLGLGGDFIYVEPIHHHAGVSTWIEQWPNATTANLLHAETGNHPMTGSEFMSRLSEAIQAAQSEAFRSAK